MLDGREPTMAVVRAGPPDPSAAATLAGRGLHFGGVVREEALESVKAYLCRTGACKSTQRDEVQGSGGLAGAVVLTPASQGHCHRDGGGHVPASRPSSVGRHCPGLR